jgi:predicted RNase H-like nuclease (RuvC/YqgF family)
MNPLRRIILSLRIAVVMLSIALSACAPGPSPKIESKREPVVDMSDRVQSLEKQVRERDKRIEELESQLEALKLIDQEHENKRKPVRPPTMLESIP